MRANAKLLSQVLERAIQSHQAGDLAAARRGYIDVLRAAPAQFDALHYLGLVEAQSGRYAEAIKHIQQALRINPRSAPAHSNLGGVFLETGRHDDALACFDRALALQPDSVEALFNRANALRGLKRHDAALDCYDAALNMQPRYLPALVNKGTLLEELGRDQEALVMLERALTVNPAQPGIHVNLGLVHRKVKRPEEALVCYDRALALAPGYADALYNRGNALVDLHRYQEAIHSFDRALSIKPDHVETLCNCANAFLYLRQYHEALACYSRAIALAPDHADARYNDAICRLTIGDFTKGWEQYEWRWKIKNLRSVHRSFAQPLWNGKALAGALYVWREQGLGDQILYASMWAELRDLVARLVVEVEPRLVNLFRRSFPEIEIVTEAEEAYAGRISAHVPIGSTGQYFRRRWEDFPERNKGYLIADTARATSLRQRLAADGYLVVGLSWISRAASWAEQKSARLQDFEPILTIPGTRFVDLQYGDTLRERNAVRESTGVEVLRLEDVDNQRDIDGLAALISACDVVVSVSNTTVHVAGALGAKVYVLLPHSQGSMWYWFVDRDDSPWYPRVELFRQPAPGDWNSAIAQVAHKIRGLRA